YKDWIGRLARPGRETRALHLAGTLGFPDRFLVIPVAARCGRRHPRQGNPRNGSRLFGALRRGGEATAKRKLVDLFPPPILRHRAAPSLLAARDSDSKASVAYNRTASRLLPLYANKSLV